MKRYIDADMLIENFRTSGLFDAGELGSIIPIIEEQAAIENSDIHNHEDVKGR